MARVKRSVSGKKHRRAILEEAQGYTGARSRHFRKANEQVMHSLRYAYRDRRARKGEFRRLWIVRINAACREHDISYSRFMAGLKAAEVDVDRKMLADLAVREPAAFSALVATARGALDAARGRPLGDGAHVGARFAAHVALDERHVAVERGRDDARTLAHERTLLVTRASFPEQRLQPLELGVGRESLRRRRELRVRSRRAPRTRPARAPRGRRASCGRRRPRPPSDRP